MGPETLGAVKSALAKDPQAEARRRELLEKAQSEEFRQAMAARDKVIEEVEAQIPGVKEARADNAGKHDTLVDVAPPEVDQPAVNPPTVDPAELTKETSPRVLAPKLPALPASTEPQDEGEDDAEPTEAPAVVKARLGVATGLLILGVLAVAGLLALAATVLMEDSDKPSVPGAQPNTTQTVTAPAVLTSPPTGPVTTTPLATPTVSAAATTATGPTPVRTSTSKPVTTSTSAWELTP